MTIQKINLSWNKLRYAILFIIFSQNKIIRCQSQCNQITSCLKDGTIPCDRIKENCPPCIYTIETNYSCFNKSTTTLSCSKNNLLVDCSNNIHAVSNSSNLMLPSILLNIANMSKKNTTSNSTVTVTPKPVVTMNTSTNTNTTKGTNHQLSNHSSVNNTQSDNINNNLTYDSSTETSDKNKYILFAIGGLIFIIIISGIGYVIISKKSKKLTSNKSKNKDNYIESHDNLEKGSRIDSDVTDIIDHNDIYTTNKTNTKNTDYSVVSSTFSDTIIMSPINKRNNNRANVTINKTKNNLKNIDERSSSSYFKFKDDNNEQIEKENVKTKNNNLFKNLGNVFKTKRMSQNNNGNKDKIDQIRTESIESSSFHDSFVTLYDDIKTINQESLISNNNLRDSFESDRLEDGSSLSFGFSDCGNPENYEDDDNNTTYSESVASYSDTITSSMRDSYLVPMNNEQKNKNNNKIDYQDNKRYTDLSMVSESQSSIYSSSEYSVNYSESMTESYREMSLMSDYDDKTSEIEI